MRKNRKLYISLMLTFTMILSTMVSVSAIGMDDPVGPNCHYTYYNTKVNSLK